MLSRVFVPSKGGYVMATANAFTFISSLLQLTCNITLPLDRTCW